MLRQITPRLTLWLAALLDELLLWREDRLMPQLSNEVLHTRKGSSASASWKAHNTELYREGLIGVAILKPLKKGHP